MSDSETYQALEYLISRYAPKLMREGGGGLTQDQGKQYGWRVRALEIARTGKYTCSQIAAQLGRSQPEVWYLMRKRGIKLPNGNLRRGKAA